MYVTNNPSALTVNGIMARPQQSQ